MKNIFPIKYLPERLWEQFSLQSPESTQYLVDRYYWVASKMLEAHFENSNQSNVDLLLTEAIAYVKLNFKKSDVPDRLLINECVGICLDLVAKESGAQSKVDRDFFYLTFGKMAKLKWYDITEFVYHYYYPIVSKLREKRFTIDRAKNLFEKGMERAECRKDYQYSHETFIIDIVDEIVRLAKIDGKRINSSDIMPQDIKVIKL